MLSNTTNHINVLYLNYVDIMFDYGIRMGFSEDAVMDAIHNVFQRLLEKKSPLDIENEKSYLIKVLETNLLMNLKEFRILILQKMVTYHFP